jgi:hypothetical protein
VSHCFVCMAMEICVVKCLAINVLRVRWEVIANRRRELFVAGIGHDRQSSASPCELRNLLERVVLIEDEWSFLACCVGSVIARMEFSGSQTTLPEGYLQCSLRRDAVVGALPFEAGAGVANLGRMPVHLLLCLVAISSALPAGKAVG